MLVIRPHDAGAIKEIDKAIRSSNLGLAPSTDGKVIRLNIPPLSGETRKKSVGAAKEFAEDQRVAVRNVRRDANKHIDQLEKDGGAGEDECAKLKEQVQELTKKAETQINELLEKKTAEIME
jgi:ribosome recycling factor